MRQFFWNSGPVHAIASVLHKGTIIQYQVIINIIHVDTTACIFNMWLYGWAYAAVYFNIVTTISNFLIPNLTLKSLKLRSGSLIKSLFISFRTSHTFLRLDTFVWYQGIMYIIHVDTTAWISNMRLPRLAHAAISLSIKTVLSDTLISNFTDLKPWTPAWYSSRIVFHFHKNIAHIPETLSNRWIYYPCEFLTLCKPWTDVIWVDDYDQ